MNIILFEKDELADSTILLSDHRAKHIVKVLQSLEGDTLRVGMLDGKTGEATVVSVKRKYPFVVELYVNLNDQPIPPPAIDLLLALPRPIMLKRILSQVTALGVEAIYLLNANRVEKSFWEAGILEEKEYRPHLIHGLEQAVDTRLPHIQIHRRFRPFAEDVLPELASQYTKLLLAHPSATENLSGCLAGSNGRILYAVGPEGGWVDFEVAKLLSAGMQPFSMGNRILKVDTAVVAIHSRICQEMEN
ncbi:MAG TPA: 16S rRNA (uracil(1498)-N(3))-methyltransferase [Desulfobacterales bacterium]|nr:16S rRNA (uracil(1498)-N(3))-methyltransferase [Desulfobacterales bacterium]HIP39473.1 16S rRNA (uracil(1498)-N(3))-methyltransferase [Desulfocapsa sulfexigens]